MAGIKDDTGDMTMDMSCHCLTLWHALYMHIYIYICAYTCIYLYIHMYMCTNVHNYMQTNMCILYIYLPKPMCIHLYVQANINDTSWYICKAFHTSELYRLTSEHVVICLKPTAAPIWSQCAVHFEKHAKQPTTVALGQWNRRKVYQNRTNMKTWFPLSISFCH